VLTLPNITQEDYNAIIAGLRMLQHVLDKEPHLVSVVDGILDNDGTNRPHDANDIDTLVDKFQYRSAT
jgi:hypothetical protein